MPISDPRDITGLLAWYSATYEVTRYADGAAMTDGWTDLSGNGNHAASSSGTTGPTWHESGGRGGGPYVEFTGSTISDTNARYFVLPNLMPASSGIEIRYGIKADDDNTDSGLHYMAPIGSDVAFFPYNDGNIYEPAGSTTRRSFSSTGITSWSYYSIASAASLWRARLNGVNKLSTGTNTYARVTAPRIGSNDDSFTRRFLGGMDYVAIFDHPLTTDELADIEAWEAANPGGGMPAASGYAEEVLVDAPALYLRGDVIEGAAPESWNELDLSTAWLNTADGPPTTYSSGIISAATGEYAYFSFPALVLDPDEYYEVQLDWAPTTPADTELTLYSQLTADVDGYDDSGWYDLGWDDSSENEDSVTTLIGPGINDYVDAMGGGEFRVLFEMVSPNVSGARYRVVHPTEAVDASGNDVPVLFGQYVETEIAGLLVDDDTGSLRTNMEPAGYFGNEFNTGAASFPRGNIFTLGPVVLNGRSRHLEISVDIPDLDDSGWAPGGANPAPKVAAIARIGYFGTRFLLAYAYKDGWLVGSTFEVARGELFFLSMKDDGSGFELLQAEVDPGEHIIAMDVSASANKLSLRVDGAEVASSTPASGFFPDTGDTWVDDFWIFGSMQGGLVDEISLYGHGLLADRSTDRYLSWAGLETVVHNSPSTPVITVVAHTGTVTTPSDMVMRIIDSTITRAPSALTVVLSGAIAGGNVTFQIDGDHDYVVQADWSGDITATSIPVPGLDAGTYTLTATSTNGVTTLVATSTFVILRDAPVRHVVGPDADPVVVGGALVDGARAWVLQDLMPGGLGSWIMPRNPVTTQQPTFDRALTPQHSTAIAGKHHIFEGAVESTHPWTFSGVTFTETDHQKLEAYGDLNRRFYLIDDENRAWVVAFERVEVTPRLRTRYSLPDEADEYSDYVADYTVTAVVYGSTWHTPVP